MGWHFMGSELSEPIRIPYNPKRFKEVARHADGRLPGSVEVPGSDDGEDGRDDGGHRLHSNSDLEDVK